MKRVLQNYLQVMEKLSEAVDDIKSKEIRDIQQGFEEALREFVEKKK